MKKIIFSILLSFILIFGCCNYTYVYAEFDEDTLITDVAKDWIERGKDNDDIPGGDTKYWNILAGILTGVGIWVIVISGAILGIRFMVASPDKKADLKKSFIVWCIGSGVILGALVIWETLITLLDIY